MTGYFIAIMAIGLASGFAQAEDGANATFTANNGYTVIGGPNSTPANFQKRDLATSIAAQKVVNPNTIKDNSQMNDQSGREFKAGDAQRQGNGGKAAAIVAGSGMVAAAIPLLASIDPIQVAAGAALMAKAGLEFGQAAADTKNANTNGAQKDLLKANAGQNSEEAKGSQQSGGSPAQAAHDAISNNPELGQLLASRGINADNFANNLASGNLTDPQAILSAVGNKTEVSPDDLAKGDASASAQLGNFIGAPPEGKNPIDTPRITNDDNAKGGRDTGGAGGAGGAGGGGGAGSNVAQNKNGAGGTDAAGGGDATALAAAKGLLAAAISGAGDGGGAAGKKRAGAEGGEGGDEEDLISSILAGFGQQRGENTADKRAAVVKATLSQMGVIRLNPKQNIFQLAHRNYRSFQKWRRAQTRVAQK